MFLLLFLESAFSDVSFPKNFTYVDAYYSTQNFGNSPNAIMGGSGGSRRYTMGRVDLSGYPTDFIVQDATIRVKKSYSFGNGVGTLSAYLVTSPWTETTLTWSNQPTIDWSASVSTASFTDAAPENFAYIFTGSSLTSLVQQWISNPQTNNGVLIRSSSNTGVVAFHTDDDSLVPVLRVTVSGGEIIEIPNSSCTYVSKYYSSTNYGSAKDALVSYNASSRLFTYIQWSDLASLSGMTVTNAVIALYRSYSYKNFPVTIGLSALGGTWEEGFATWTNQPQIAYGYNSPLATVTGYDSDPGETQYEFSGTAITALVQSWIHDPATNFGFRLSLSNSNGIVAVYTDDESDLRQRCPEVIISPVSFNPSAPSLSVLNIHPGHAIKPVNRKVMGITLMSAATETADINETIENLLPVYGTSGRAWASTTSYAYWDRIRPHVQGLGLINLNGMAPPTSSPTSAYYNSTSDNNLSANDQPAALANRIQVITNQNVPFSGWEIWNEPQFRANGTWPAADFARYVCECSNAIRSIFPNMNIAAPLHEADNEWNYAMLSTINAMSNGSTANPINYAVTHPYDFYWQSAQLNMGSYYARASGAEVMRECRLIPKWNTLQSINANWKLVASEWNVHPVDLSTAPINITHDMAAAINLATMLGNFMDLDFESAQFHSIRANSFGMMDAQQTLYPTGYVLGFYGEHFRGNLVEFSAETDTYSYKYPYDDLDVDIPVVVAQVAYDPVNNKLCVMLINRHRDSAAPISIVLNNFNVTSTQATVHSIGEGGDPESTNFTPVTSTTAIDSGENITIGYSIPAHCIQAIIITGEPQ